MQENSPQKAQGWTEKSVTGGKNNKKDKRQKTESDRDRGGGRSMSCVSYLGLSVLADRIEVFSIYANHSHRPPDYHHALPRVLSLHPIPPSTPLAIPCSLPFHSPPRNPCLSSSFVLRLIYPSTFFSFAFLHLSVISPSPPSALPPFSLHLSLPLSLPLLYWCALWDTCCSASRTRQREFYIWRTLACTRAWWSAQCRLIMGDWSSWVVSWGKHTVGVYKKMNILECEKG